MNQGTLTKNNDFDQCIQTNIDRMPVEDYLNYQAFTCGFADYADMRAHGYTVDLTEL